MPVARFDYIAPTSVDEAVAALVKGGRDTRVMAGGTDLLVKIRHRMLFPDCFWLASSGSRAWMPSPSIKKTG